MSLSSTTNKVQFDISGGPVTTYPFLFKFWAAGEIMAIVSTASGDVTLAQGVDYTLSAPGDTGSITRISTWPVGTRLTIARQLDLTQTTDLVNGSVQDAEVYETAIDRGVAQAQQINETIDRIVRFPITDPTASPDMPSAEDRAGKYLGFDAVTGDPIAIAAAVGGTTVSPYMATMLDDVDALAAQKTLGLLASGASAAITAGMQAFLGSDISAGMQAVLATDPPAEVATMIETGDIAGMEADAVDIDYDGTTVDLGATDLQDAVETLGSVLKGLIEDSGQTYSAASIAAQFKRACRTFGQRVGILAEFDDKFTPDADNPYLLLNVDQDISATNWPLLVPHLRSVKMEAGGATSWSYTASGGIMTLSGTGLASIMAALGEEQTVHGSYTNFMVCTISGTDYVISNINTGSNQITVTVSPPASGTVEFYPHRISGSTTTAREFKDVGRALYSADGATYINACRRRDRGQGHNHSTGELISRLSGDGVSNTAGASAGFFFNSDTTYVTDGNNGAPRIGPTTDAANSVKYRYRFGGTYLP